MSCIRHAGFGAPKKQQKQSTAIPVWEADLKQCPCGSGRLYEVGWLNTIFVCRCSLANSPDPDIQVNFSMRAGDAKSLCTCRRAASPIMLQRRCLPQQRL